LIITAYQHCFRYDEPSKEHKWAQIVGGGPRLYGPKNGGKHVDFPTVIEGKVENKQLKIIVHNVSTNSVIAEYLYKARKV
jgi:hypothetical protein